jgi:hypothetical protein
LPPGTEPIRGLSDKSLPITKSDASSFESGSTPTKAVDKNLYTAWKALPTMPQWLKLDLGGIKSVAGVGIYSTANRPTVFSIRTSTDDNTYATAITVRNATYTQNWNATNFAARDARYVRIEIEEAEALPVQINEIEVYPAAKVADDQQTLTEEFSLLPAIVAAIIVGVLCMVLYIWREKIRLRLTYLRG